MMSNSDMHPTERTDERLTELEIKASFNEDLLDQLNQVIVRQQQEIDWLLREVRQLKQHLPDGHSASSQQPAEELPPHY